MDPEQTLLDADIALRDGDPARAEELLGYYWAWRKHGGFEPRDVHTLGTHGDAFADSLKTRLDSFE